MKPAPFEYHAPESLSDVTALLAEHGDDAKVLAGGQSLVPMLALRLTRFDAHRRPQPGRRAARRRAPERHPHDQGDDPPGDRRARHRRGRGGARCSPQAIPLIGHFQIRNRGTVGGSIAHADPASELPAVALALDAELEVAGASGTRTRPGRRVLRRHVDHHASSADEMLTAVHFPVWAGRCGFAVDEVARRSGDFALAGVVAAVELDDSGAVDALGHRASSAWGPRRCGRARPRQALVGTVAHHAPTSTEIGRLAVADTDPTADVHASAEYRKHVGAHLVERALDRALGARAWLSTPSTFTVNGESHSGSRRGAQDARRLPPRGLRAHRHAPRVRARRVRRVHGPRRRRGRALVPDVRGAGRRRRHHDHRGHRSRRRFARPGAGGVPPGPRAAVRVLHARASS